jgi:hypothetical protein
MIPNADIVTFTWVLLLVGFVGLGVMIALFYYADRKPRKKSKK